MSLLQGLPPRVTPHCTVLVLGSMPGSASLSQARYYAHPRNRFWPLMQELFGVDAGAGYEARLHALNDAGVGLWDVIGQCRRQGSLDTAIIAASEVANPVPELLRQFPRIGCVAFNGAKAAQAFTRHFPQGLPDGVRGLALPSTSPANASWSMQRLQQAWRALLDAR